MTKPSEVIDALAKAKYEPIATNRNTEPSSAPKSIVNSPVNKAEPSSCCGTLGGLCKRVCGEDFGHKDDHVTCHYECSRCGNPCDSDSVAV